MGHAPPNTVGSRSPTAKSSIFLSPSVVRIVVPFIKHCGPDLGPGPGPGLGPGPGPGPGTKSWALANLAKIAHAAITPIFVILRRDFQIPVGAFSRSDMFASRCLEGQRVWKVARH